MSFTKFKNGVETDGKLEASQAFIAAATFKMVSTGAF